VVRAAESGQGLSRLLLRSQITTGEDRRDRGRNSLVGGWVWREEVRSCCCCCAGGAGALCSAQVCTPAVTVTVGTKAPLSSAQLAVQVRPIALPALPALPGVFVRDAHSVGSDTIIDRGSQVPRPGGREKWAGRYLQVRRGQEDGPGRDQVHSAERQELLGRPVPRGVTGCSSWPPSPDQAGHRSKLGLGYEPGSYLL
jgi:hypothetical protein